MSRTYPVTVFTSRYGGVYEGGSYVAALAHTTSIPDAAQGDDTECSEFFMRNRDRLGVGETPEEAIKDLEAKIPAEGRIKEWDRFDWDPYESYHAPAISFTREEADVVAPRT